MDLYMRTNIMQDNLSGYNVDFALSFPEYNNFIGAQSSYNPKTGSLVDNSEVLTIKDGTERFANNYYIVDGETYMGSGDEVFDHPSYMDGEMLFIKDSPSWSSWRLVEDFTKLPTVALEWVEEHM